MVGFENDDEEEGDREVFKWRRKRRREKGGKDKKEMLKEYTEVEESAREREEREPSNGGLAESVDVDDVA